VTSDSVRWGFIGAGFIASTALAPAVHRAEGAELYAVAARERERAEKLEPQRAYDRYQDLLDDPTIDAVYISLTNDAHLPWIGAALAASKHVLCEKPLTLDATQCDEAWDAALAADRLLVEATWMRWHPRYRRADALLGQGANGQVRGILGTFTFDGVPESNYRLDPKLGGGALLDLGPYVLAPAVDWSPTTWSVSGSCSINDRGADVTTDATLISAETTAVLRVSIVHPERQALSVTAEGISVEWGDQPFTSWRQQAGLTLNDGSHQWHETFEPCDAYQLMVEHVSRAIRGDDDAYLPDPSASLETARLIDQIRVESRMPQDDEVVDLERA
jgi:predicted dehydrogenase